MRSLDRRHAVDDRDSGGWGEDEVRVGGGGVGLLGGEGEGISDAVGFVDLHGLDNAVGVRGEAEGRDALFEAAGDSGESVSAVGVLAGDEVVHLFFELGVAEEEAQRGAQIVEVLGGDALGGGVAGGVEVGVMSVENEEFSGWVGVGPAHAAGLFEQQGAGLAAVDAHSRVGLSEIDLKRAEGIVMVVHPVGEGMCGKGLGACGAREQSQKTERGQQKQSQPALSS